MSTPGQQPLESGSIIDAWVDVRCATYETPGGGARGDVNERSNEDVVSHGIDVRRGEGFTGQAVRPMALPNVQVRRIARVTAERLDQLARRQARARQHLRSTEWGAHTAPQDPGTRDPETSNNRRGAQAAGTAEQPPRATASCRRGRSSCGRSGGGVAAPRHLHRGPGPRRLAGPDCHRARPPRLSRPQRPA